MKMHKTLGDLTGFGLGYGLTSPDPEGIVHSLLAAIPVSQPVMDEIVKAFAGLIIAVLSRWLYARVLEKKKPNTENRQPPEETVLSNLKNINENGNEKTQNSK